MKSCSVSRRDFLMTGAAVSLAGCAGTDRPLVSIVRIPNDNIDYAVEHAIDLLGGIADLTYGKERIVLKPNLVMPDPNATTNPKVVSTLTRLMQGAGKDVTIAEGSAAAEGFNVQGRDVYRTRNETILNRMQDYIYEQLGYAELAKTRHVPLVNLHSGEMWEVPVPGGYVYDNISLHPSLVETDLLCSVPVMKTHMMATVTLGMKNVIGAFPGSVYYSLRSAVHDKNAEKEPTGTSMAIVDMVRANKMGLTVIDGSTAMEGDGTSQGTPFQMGVIVAGTDPLATDMVAARVMGIEPEEVPTFTYAHEAGMTPRTIEEIEVRGESIEAVRRPFVRPNLLTWKQVRQVWRLEEV
jgi:uncharacterized protein (DUF362 family)